MAMNVLSLFDGLSCGQIALNRIGLKPSKYYAAEIDKYAIQVTQANYPKTIQLGDVTKWQEWGIDFSTIDLVTGGFPCQAWSMAGKQLGDKDERGMLFWTMLDIMQAVLKANPKAKFLIENVKMKKEFEEYITHHTTAALGLVQKTLINSALVSAQNRNRYYWTNWHVTQPEDKAILVKDILASEKDWVACVVGDSANRNVRATGDKAGFLTANYYKGVMAAGRPFVATPSSIGTTLNTDNQLIRIGTATDIKGHDYNKRIYSIEGKCPTLAASSGGNLEPKVAINEIQYRKLTPLECERLQTVPENYTNHVSNTQRYKMLGNGWTVDVICHIYSCMELPVQVVARQLSLFEDVA